MATTMSSQERTERPSMRMSRTGVLALAFWPCGRRLEIYGSEGWGFESLRACH